MTSAEQDAGRVLSTAQTISKPMTALPPETTLWLARHGETAYNRAKRVQGRQINMPLNATGEAQAQALAERLKNENFSAIYASTLLRAQQTARFVAQYHLETPAYFEPDLEEMSWGILEGKPTTPDVQAAFNTLLAEWGAGNFEYGIPEGESIYEVQARALRMVEKWQTQHAGEQILIVTHGRYLRVLLSSILPQYGLARMQDIKHANTGLNIVTWNGKQAHAELLNCTQHLEHLDRATL